MCSKCIGEPCYSCCCSSNTGMIFQRWWTFTAIAFRVYNYYSVPTSDIKYKKKTRKNRIPQDETGLSDNNRPWHKLAVSQRFACYLAIFHNDLSPYKGHYRPAT